MSHLRIVRKSKWRWIAHVATFIAALLGTCSVTASAHSADLYQYGTYPAPQYQPPPNYYYTGAESVSVMRLRPMWLCAMWLLADYGAAGNAPSPSSRHVW